MKNRRRISAVKLRGSADNQQWLLDYLVKTTGRVQNFFYETAGVPKDTQL